jgi:hypothetical protein
MPDEAQVVQSICEPANNNAFSVLKAKSFAIARLRDDCPDILPEREMFQNVRNAAN